MQNLVSNLFIMSINKLNSNQSRYIMKKLYESKEPTTTKRIAADASIKNLRSPAHVQYWIDDISKYKLAEKTGDGYLLSPLGRTLMGEAKKNPEIQNLRDIKRGSRYSTCNEELVLLTILSGGEKTRDELYSAIKGDPRRVTRSITRLMRKDLLRKSSYLHRYFRLEKETNREELSTPEKNAYGILLSQKGEYVTGIDLCRNLKHTSYYSLGLLPLVNKGIASKKEKLLKYNLSLRGKTVANSLKKISDIAKKIEPPKKSEISLNDAIVMLSKK